MFLNSRSPAPVPTRDVLNFACDRICFRTAARVFLQCHAHFSSQAELPPRADLVKFRASLVCSSLSLFRKMTRGKYLRGLGRNFLKRRRSIITANALLRLCCARNCPRSFVWRQSCFVREPCGPFDATLTSWVNSTAAALSPILLERRVRTSFFNQTTRVVTS